MDHSPKIISESKEQVHGKASHGEPKSNTANADIQGEDEASRLRALAADVRDQDDLERDIGRQVSCVLYGVFLLHREITLSI